MLIYAITNKVNGKRYIGQTVISARSRWKDHCSTGTSCIQKAIKKHGKENFLFEVWEKESITSPEHLNEREKFWIYSLNTISPNGYNIAIGGNSSYNPNKVTHDSVAKVYQELKERKLYADLDYCCSYNRVVKIKIIALHLKEKKARKARALRAANSRHNYGT